METTMQTEREYWARINKAIDFIEENLEKPLVIADVAEASSFSKFHFHRIFHGMLGETPFQFLTRVRLEKAAFMLLAKPNYSFSEIAVDCGFSGLSVFSRNFKKHFGISATAYRNSKNGQMDSNFRKSDARAIAYFCSSSQTLKWKTEMETNQGVEVKVLPTMTVAYVRHVGPYKGDAVLFERLYGKLTAWAEPRGLMVLPGVKTLTMAHDDPNVTPEEKQRISACLVVPEDTKVEGEIGKMKIEGGSYAVGRFVVAPDEFEKAW
ncbi:MAG: AraC family transcriptional regulator, partial [Cytophagales bacterium]|nr:AraC family transcriptional regulator [Cytophagales bacterium]